MVAIYIDENILNQNNIFFYKTKVDETLSFKDNGYFNKLECIYNFVEVGVQISVEDQENDKFKLLGDYVFVKAHLDVSYIHHVEEFNFDDIMNIKESMGL
ncbi:MAG TPA: hypothetical protein K8U79_07400 [Clostridium perfringens]|nr:hypothetical protein [Clostridium perfringens]